MAAGHDLTDQVRILADEARQRKARFWSGPWNSGPRDEVALFFDHAATPEFLARSDNGLSRRQASALMRLSAMMSRLRDSPPEAMRAEAMVDDPNWRAIRRQAKATLGVLSEPG